MEQCVEETDKQVLVHLRAEKLLKAEVGVRIDVFLFSVVCNISNY